MSGLSVPDDGSGREFLHPPNDETRNPAPNESHPHRESRKKENVPPGEVEFATGFNTGSQILWPANVRRIDHIAPPDHRSFYNSLRFTLNVTRSSMVRAGYSPSVRIFEAAACGTVIITDPWDGFDHFFTPGKEILPVRSAGEVLDILKTMPEERAAEISSRARENVLSAHTAKHRAVELEQYAMAFMGTDSRMLEALRR
jgi:glycosyltransferase involved in cell wall biosynthesis